MIEHDVHSMDVLLAMSESLFENTGAGKKNHLFTVKEVPDREVSFSTITKPPKEMFYRNTVTYSIVLPPPVLEKRCTCLYMCHGAPATIRCMSCATYDPKGVGFYCDLCFQSRHPWYRIPHLYMSIDKDENIEHTLKVAHRKTEALRYEMEGKNLLKNVQRQKKSLDYVADDEHVETQMIAAGRKLTGMEERMRQIRKNLRQDIRQAGDVVTVVKVPTSSSINKSPTKTTGVTTTQSNIGRGGPPTKPTLYMSLSDDEAATRIQSLLRGRYIRNVISFSHMQRYVRVWDPSSFRDYYYNKDTKMSSWSRPSLILQKHFDVMEYVTEDASSNDASNDNNSNNNNAHKKLLKWCCKRSAPRRRPAGERISTYEFAEVVVKGFLRCIAARQKLLAEADRVYRRVPDAESESHFYILKKRGQTISFWSKPTIYLSTEPPLLVNEEEKRSPRFNRA